MSVDTLLDIMNNLCNMLINGGQVPEEVIELMVDAGANIESLKAMGFNDEQIADYAYYESLMSGKSEDEVMAEIQ